MRQLVLGLYLMLICACVSAAEADLPWVSGRSNTPECRDAAALARSMFYSKAAEVYAPLVVPPEVRSTLVLGASEQDISAGHALKGTDDFEQVPMQYNQTAHWSKSTQAGKRLVLINTPQNWRGDIYSLYVLDESMEPAAFVKKIEEDLPRDRLAPFIERSWRPPLLFKLPGEKRSIWFIDVGVGLDYDSLRSWSVYAHGATEPDCTIVFRNSPPSESASRSLPAAVRSLAVQLNEILGSGADDGPNHPTQLRRKQAAHVLENAVYRPWALSNQDAYDSREQVDQGLKQWALVNRARARAHAELLKTYPKAERALAGYYAQKFRLSDRQASEVSIWVIDVVFRSFFSFETSGAHEDGPTNPWPDGIPRQDSSKPFRP